MNFDKIIEKIKGLDEIGRLSLIRWGLVVLVFIFIIPCELISGIVGAIFAILFWGYRACEGQLVKLLVYVYRIFFNYHAGSSEYIAAFAFSW